MKAPARVRLRRSPVPWLRRHRWRALGGAALLIAVGAALALLWGGSASAQTNLNDGDGGWPRNASLVITFSQDMDQRSVEHGFHLTPAAPYQIRSESRRRFIVSPQLRPDTRYEVTIQGTRRLGVPVTYRRRFRTAPAPAVAQITLQGQPMRDGQTRVPLQPTLHVRFTQAMDPQRMEVLVNGQPAALGAWDPDRKGVGLAPTLLPGTDQAMTIPAKVRNARQDTLLADVTIHFRTVVQLPSSGQHPLNGPPALVQLDNAGPARPQAGLQQADMVYEYLTEYDITRFTAIYYSNPPPVVGPVRSARLISIPLQQSFQGVLFCSGAGDYVLGQLWKEGIPMHINDYSKGGVFYRDSRRYAPHNVMLPGPALDQHRRDFSLPLPSYVISPSLPDTPLAGGTATPMVSVPVHHVVWQASGGEYRRVDEGRPFRDANTGEQVHAKNVIVQVVPARVTDIVEDVNGGAHSVQYEMNGQGTAFYYSGGQALQGRWRHAAREPIEYLDAEGHPVRLNSGLTWVHLVSG